MALSSLVIPAKRSESREPVTRSVLDRNERSVSTAPRTRRDDKGVFGSAPEPSQPKLSGGNFYSAAAEVSLSTPPYRFRSSASFGSM